MKVKPGDIVENTGRTTRQRKKYELVVKVYERHFGRYAREPNQKSGAIIMYQFADGTSGFSYAYTKIE